MLNVIPNETITPRPGGQSGFVSDFTHFIIGLEGGWFSGKTWAGARKLISNHTINSFDEFGSPTFVPSAAIAPTFANAMDFVIPELQSALSETGVSYEFKSHGSVAEGRFAAPALVVKDFGYSNNPSVIIIRSADDPKKITGWNVGSAWGDEPSRWKADYQYPMNDAFIQLMGRVRHPQARLRQIVFTFTNEGDGTRVYKEFHKEDNTDCVIYRARTKDNPTAAEFYQLQKRMLNDKLAEQYLDGGVVSYRGSSVYPSFDKTRHVNHSLKLSSALPLHLSFDFNINPGMICEIGQYDPQSDIYYVVDELYGDNWSVRNICAEFKRWLNGRVFPEYHIFGDATGRARNVTTGETSYDVIRSYMDAIIPGYRIRVPEFNPPVVDRINAFEMALNDHENKLHWQCNANCIRLIKDLSELKLDTGNGIDKSDSDLSHASDAETYRVSYLRPIRRIQVPSGRYSVGAA